MAQEHQACDCEAAAVGAASSPRSPAVEARPAAGAPPAAGSRLCLGVLVFVCGWVLMMLEMLGARLLAPYFGTGIHVWGSVIGVFLLALSIGYFVGGKLSTRRPYAGAVTALLIACAFWIGLLPFVHRPLNERIFALWVLDWNGSEQWASLAAAALLFLTPSVLLGTVTPFVVRLAATDLRSVGEEAGFLYAISTLGSFLGCLITSFYLILWMGMNRILQLHALVLVSSAVTFWVVWRRLSRPSPALVEEAP